MLTLKNSIEKLGMRKIKVLGLSNCQLKCRCESEWWSNSANGEANERE